MTEHPGDDPIATAETELAEAQTALATLEGDHVDGKNVTPAQFDKAEQRVSMARRGIERAKRLVQRRKETEALTVIEALDHDVAAHNAADRIAPVRHAYAAAVDAVRDFLNVHQAYQQEAGRLESRAHRADHRVRVTRIDYGTSGKPWPEQLLADARGYARIHDRSALPQSHALAPEAHRLRSARAQLTEKLTMNYGGDLDAMRADDPAAAARYDRITARLTEIETEEN